MADQQHDAMDRADGRDIAPTGGETTRAHRTTDTSPPGATTTPGAGTSADVSDVVTQGDGTYDGAVGGPGTVGGVESPTVRGGLDSAGGDLHGHPR